MALFAAVYPRLDPDQETISRFYGLLALIPAKVKELWLASSVDDDVERNLLNGLAMSRLENIAE